MPALIELIFYACFMYIYMRLLYPYGILLVRFVFTEPFKWNKYIEKPRLFFHGLGLMLMHFSFSTIYEYWQAPQTFYFISSFLVFILGIFLTQITWTGKFKRIVIPKIKEKLKSSKNFNISITESQLEKLYENMVRYDMVIIDKTSKDDFIQCFLKDWDEHDAKIHLKLKNPACKEFYERFKLTFPKNDLQLIDFIKNSHLLRREDGQRYNYDTVRNALTRNRVSKRSEELEAVFSTFS